MSGYLTLSNAVAALRTFSALNLKESFGLPESNKFTRYNFLQLNVALVALCEVSATFYSVTEKTMPRNLSFMILTARAALVSTALWNGYRINSSEMKWMGWPQIAILSQAVLGFFPISTPTHRQLSNALLGVEMLCRFRPQFL